MPISNNFRQRDAESWVENAIDGGVDRRVNDSTAHQKLDAIATALGGATSSTTVVLNLTIPIANVELSQALPTNTKNFILKSRLGAKLRLAYSSGGTNTSYFTIMPGNTFSSNQFYITQALYIQSSKAGDTVEIVASY